MLVCDAFGYKVQGQTSLSVGISLHEATKEGRHSEQHTSHLMEANNKVMVGRAVLFNTEGRA